MGAGEGGDIALMRAELANLRALMDERDRLYGSQFAGAKDGVTVALAAQKELVTAAFAASERAILKAEESTGQRLEAMNEFRRQLDRERGGYVTNDRMEDRTGAIVARLETLEKAQANSTGRFAATSIGLTILMFVVSIGVGILLRH